MIKNQLMEANWVVSWLVQDFMNQMMHHSSVI